MRDGGRETCLQGQRNTRRSVQGACRRSLGMSQHNGSSLCVGGGLPERKAASNIIVPTMHSQNASQRIDPGLTGSKTTCQMRVFKCIARCRRRFTVGGSRRADPSNHDDVGLKMSSSLGEARKQGRTTTRSGGKMGEETVLETSQEQDPRVHDLESVRWHTIKLF